MDEEKCKELIANFTAIDDYMRKTWIKLFREVKAYQDGKQVDEQLESAIQDQLLGNYMAQYEENRMKNARILLGGLRFVNKNGQPLRMMPMLKLDPALLERPLYH